MALKCSALIIVSAPAFQPSPIVVLSGGSFVGLMTLGMECVWFYWVEERAAFAYSSSHSCDYWQTLSPSEMSRSEVFVHSLRVLRSKGSVLPFARPASVAIWS